MDPIKLNHSQILYSTLGIKPVGEITAKLIEVPTLNSAQKSSVEITISSAAIEFAANNVKPRFSSLEELSEHKSELYSQWTTLEEFDSGTRRPFASEEDLRLSKLTLKELMKESTDLPRVDKNGHLQNGLAGTEQGDRISVAIANKLNETQFNYQKAALKVESSVNNFKKHIDKQFKIDANTYDVIFRNGKASIVGKMSSVTESTNNVTLKKIQDILDNPDSNEIAKNLSQSIKNFNAISTQLISNELTQHIYGSEQNPYLSKHISTDWLMDGTNYSDVSQTSSINQKYLLILAEAREKYSAALKNETHLSNYNIDQGLLELTELRMKVDVSI